MLEKNKKRIYKLLIHIELKGVGGHSSKPYLTKNPIIAGFEIVHIIFNRVWWSFSQFENIVVIPVNADFGTKQNIIPEEGIIEFRAEYSESIHKEKLKNIFSETLQAINSAYGVSSFFKIIDL